MTPTQPAPLDDAGAMAVAMYAAHAAQYVGTSVHPLPAWDALDESSRQHWLVVAEAAHAHLAARLAELERQRKNWMDEAFRISKLAQTYLVERDRAEAELAAVREDGARLDWLERTKRGTVRMDFFDLGSILGLVPRYLHWGEGNGHATLRAAIDAARSTNNPPT